MRPARIARNDGLINSEIVKTVAIIGASSNPNKFGNKAVRAFLRQGYTVYPVNPNEPEVEGLASILRPHSMAISWTSQWTTATVSQR